VDIKMRIFPWDSTVNMEYVSNLRLSVFIIFFKHQIREVNRECRDDAFWNHTETSWCLHVTLHFHIFTSTHHMSRVTGIVRFACQFIVQCSWC